MKQKNNRITSYFILFSLLLIIGVVYAILQANLQINGTAKIANNLWDVHFNNVQVNENSVPIGTGDTPATIDPSNNCKVDFSVTLSLPGDFYEFTVDAVNTGTIDAMIGTLEKNLRVGGTAVDEIPNYLNYMVTYSDGTEILENHILKKGTFETYKVRIEFRSDIDEEDLPDTTTLSMSIEPVYIQADSGAVIPDYLSSLYHVVSSNAVIDNVASTYVTNANGIQFDQVSSNTNGKGVYLRAGTENDTYPIYYYRGDVNDNHVIFAGFCWKIVRTTDTGGVKMIYDGVPSNDGECNNMGATTMISAANKYNTTASLLSDVGYMYGEQYMPGSMIGAGLYYAPDVTYENGVYTLSSKDSYPVEIKNDISGTNLSYHHYTCGSSTETTCTSVFYIYRIHENTKFFYITLSNGKKVEDAISEMLTNSSNENDSTIKTIIDTWYQNNMIDYTNKIEDTVFCNDRTISEYAGWDPNGGTPDGNHQTDYILLFGGYERSKDTHQPSLICPQVNDAFTVNQSSNGNGKLTYPIGLLTVDEAILAGMILSGGRDHYLNNNAGFWLGTPSYFPSAFLYLIENGILYNYYGSYDDYGTRPLISLIPGIKILGGDGTSTTPYLVE